MTDESMTTPEIPWIAHDGSAVCPVPSWCAGLGQIEVQYGNGATAHFRNLDASDFAWETKSRMDGGCITHWRPLVPNPNPEPVWLTGREAAEALIAAGVGATFVQKNNESKARTIDERLLLALQGIGPDVRGRILHLRLLTPAPEKAAGATEKTGLALAAVTDKPSPENDRTQDMIERDIKGHEKALPKPEALSKRQRAWRDIVVTVEDIGGSGLVTFHDGLPDEVCEMPRRVRWGA